MNKDIHKRIALDNAEAHINYMAGLPDKVLASKLELVNIQSALAQSQKNTGAYELLEIWRSQLIEARIYKAENKIPDALNEIEQAIADIETFTLPKTANKESNIENMPSYTPTRKRPETVHNADNQLSLF